MILKSSKFIFPLLIAVCLCGLHQTTARTKDKKQDDLIERQKSYFDAVIKKDFTFLDALLAEDYIGAYSLGAIDKVRESKDLREFPLLRYEMSDIKTAFPNAKTAIIAFKLHVVVLYDGKEFSEDDILNCVWTKHKKVWLLSAQSAAKIKKDS